jgi:hydrogenase expression/formation protein HypE
MTDESVSIQGLVCPVPLSHDDRIVLGHGSGGKMSHDLIKRLFLNAFENPALGAGNDAAVLHMHTATSLAVSTDSHVVSPLFFPGGDIGRLAVCGTVNDIAMLGAQPLCLTAGFILEEGLELSTLERVVMSMRSAALEAGVQIIAGDTKVVQKGKADGLYINTAGVGAIPANLNIGGELACPGDVVIISGLIGDHGIAVLSARGELGFESDIASDVAPLNHLVNAMLQASQQVHVLRDPTRGGLATSLNEIALQSGVGITIDEESIPVRPAVNAACEMLGFDPLYVANEGKLIAIVAPEAAEKILTAMRAHPYGTQAVVIGRVVEKPAGRVLMKTSLGTTRIVDMLAGEMLPRIC